MIGDLPGTPLETTEMADCGGPIAMGQSLFSPTRDSSPGRAVGGAPSSHLHTGQVGGLDPAPQTVKSADSLREFFLLLFLEVRGFL